MLLFRDVETLLSQRNRKAFEDCLSSSSRLVRLRKDAGLRSISQSRYKKGPGAISSIFNKALGLIKK